MSSEYSASQKRKIEFDSFADEYQQMHKKNISISGELPEYFSEYKIIDLKSKVSKQKSDCNKIFDFGCGIGNSVPFFYKHFSAANFSFTDVSLRSMDIAIQRFGNPDNFHQIVDSIPLRTESQDISFSACVFHHIPNDEHIYWLSEIKRVTKLGGTLAIYEHNPLNFLTRRAVSDCPFDVNAELIPATKMKLNLIASGWTDINVEYKIFFPSFLRLFRPFERYLWWFPLGAQYVIFARKPT